MVSSLVPDVRRCVRLLGAVLAALQVNVNRMSTCQYISIQFNSYQTYLKNSQKIPTFRQSSNPSNSCSTLKGSEFKGLCPALCSFCFLLRSGNPGITWFQDAWQHSERWKSVFLKGGITCLTYFLHATKLRSRRSSKSQSPSLSLPLDVQAGCVCKFLEAFHREIHAADPWDRKSEAKSLSIAAHSEFCMKTSTCCLPEDLWPQKLNLAIVKTM